MANQNPSRREMLKYISGVVGSLVLPDVSFANSKRSGFTLDDYINAVIKIESSGNPNSARYEKHVNDWSYGLGQLLTKTAKGVEARHPHLPKLGKTKDQIKNSLCNPKINRAYTTALFKEGLDFYKDPFLAVAAYNAGYLAPRNARCQEQLNDFYHTDLTADGDIGKESKEVIRRFQIQYGLKANGALNNSTYRKIQEVWKRKNPWVANKLGIIPQNNYTPNHVRKFKEALGIN